MFKQYAIIIGLGLSLGLTACAQSTDVQSAEQAKPTSSDAAKSRERSGERRGPRAGREGRTLPEAAYAACDNLEAQSACTVETPRGTRDGVCRVREGDTRAVCFPSRPEGGRREGGRPEGRRPRPSGQ